MPFDHGTVTFTMFDLPGDLPENLLELFAARKAGPLDGVTEELQLGWVTGHHLLDTTIDAETAMIGGSYHLTLRQAIRKMPSSLLTAVCKREEKAYAKANNLEYVNSKMKKQIKEEAIEKHIQKMPPALSGIPMVLDPESKLLYLGASSQAQIDRFVENFYQVAKVEPLQLNPALLLERFYQTTEASFPALTVGGHPSDERTIGRDFLMFLWYYSETAGKLDHPDYGQFDLLVEAPFVFVDDNAQGAGETSIKKGDSPQRGAEVKAALEVGKKLKRAKISLTRDKQVWVGTFDADLFAFRSFKLPEPEGMGEAEVFDERIECLGILREAFVAYFRKFADSMMGMEFPEFEKAIKSWAKDRDAV